MPNYISHLNLKFFSQPTGKAIVSIGAVCAAFIAFGLKTAPGQSKPELQQIGAPPPGSGPIDYKGYVRVIEGDTAEIYPNGNQAGIGVIGIKAPPGNTPCGQAAIKFMQLLTKDGLYLAEEPAIGFDAKKRRMYYGITRDNLNIALELVKAGVAHSSGEGKDKDELDAADIDVQLKKIGCLNGGAVGTVTGQTASNIAGGVDATVREAGNSREETARAALPVAPRAAKLAGGFSQQVVASGFSNQTGVAFLPDGRILVAEKHGIVKVVKNGAVLPTPFIDISSKVNDYWDHGLIGITADPNFATNGYVYLLFTYENNASDYNGTKTARLSRFTASGDTASLSSEAVILGASVGSSCQNFPAGADCLPSDNPSHSIGQVRFDSSGNMFVTVGDSASFNVVDDLALRAQDLTSLAGKMLHVSSTGAGLSMNPFWNNNPSANQSKVWAYGVRNSFRFNLRSGMYPYSGDVGWDTWEEINAVTKGANLGWPCYEGLSQQPGYAPKSVCQTLYGQGASAVKFGAITWSHFYAGNHVSTAAVGGTFYTGTAYPAQYQGAFFYGDYGQNFIRYFTTDGNDNLVSGPFDFIFGADGPTQIEQGSDGNLYYNSIVAGEIRKIVYNGPDTVPPAIVTSNPASNATSVALSATVKSTFSKLLDPNTIANSLTVVKQSNGQPVAGSVVYDGTSQTITLTPSVYLIANTTYVATVKGGANGVKDLSGNALGSDQVWTFTTYAYQLPPSGTTDVSSLTMVTMTNGWGPAEINMSNGEQAPNDGHTITIRGAAFAKGVGVHAPSDIQYYLGNACSTFTATIGIDDEVAPNGTVVFQVFGDGVKLYDSGVVAGTSAAKNINVDMTGKNFLELTVTDGGDGNASDHADWATPRITCGSPPATTISNVQATGVTMSAATISWMTNNIADSQVDYGTTIGYGSSTPLDLTLVTSHSQQISGLTANTGYHFRVKSRDSGGTLVTSVDAMLTTPSSTTTYLSDMTWTSMTNGWGPAEKDTSNGENAAGDGRTISIRGATYAKGLGVHAASDIKYNVGGCRTFISDIGIDDEVQPNGTVIFQVWADGGKLYDSGLVNATMAAKNVSVDITGKNQLELVVADDGDGLNSDHSDWAGARVVCGGPPPPIVTIISPAPTLTYKVGDVINYSGSAKDGSGNAIPASGLAWQIIIHHCPGGNCHTHPFSSGTGTSGTFTVPDHGDQSFFEIMLTATDSGGLKSSTSVSLQPQTAQLTLTTAPSGLQVIYNGTSSPAPTNITTIVGSLRTVQVASPQGSNNFSSWSDGGAQQHNITIGAANLTLTATFTPAPFTITATSPANGATGIATNTTVTATFSKAIDQSTLTSATFNIVPQGSTTQVPAAMTYDPVTLTGKITPSAALGNSTAYTATVKGGASGVKDSGGNPLNGDMVWIFTIGSATSVTYLSDLTWTSMTNGWGPVERDMSNGENAAGDGRTLSIRGVTYARGLGAHAASDVRYAIPQGCSAFTASVGIDDEVAPQGSVIFQVWTDGTKVYDSGLMTGAMAAQRVSVSLNGKVQLQLVVADDGNGLSYDHADWADAQMSCGATRPPVGTSYLSNLVWTSMTNGYGPVERDTSNGGSAAGDGRTISIRGVAYAKGLGAHAASDIRYNLGGACKTFTATVGVDDEVAPQGSVVFQVWTDSAKVYDSGIVTGTAAGKSVSVDLTGKSTLRLVVADDGDGIGYDHADWANAQINCP